MTPERQAEIRAILGDPLRAGLRVTAILPLCDDLLSALTVERNRADAAERQIDAVWAALGITTVPLGMTAAAEVAKLKERADAAEAALKAATEWRPMETVPKDGTSFSAFMRFDNDGTPHSMRVLTMRYDAPSGEFRTDIYPFHIFTPDRWLPLPTPPAGGAHD